MCGAATGMHHLRALQQQALMQRARLWLRDIGQCNHAARLTCDCHIRAGAWFAGLCPRHRPKQHRWRSDRDAPAVLGPVFFFAASTSTHSRLPPKTLALRGTSAEPPRVPTLLRLPAAARLASRSIMFAKQHDPRSAAYDLRGRGSCIAGACTNRERVVAAALRRTCVRAHHAECPASQGHHPARHACAWAVRRRICNACNAAMGSSMQHRHLAVMPTYRCLQHASPKYPRHSVRPPRPQLPPGRLCGWRVVSLCQRPQYMWVKVVDECTWQTYVWVQDHACVAVWEVAVAVVIALNHEASRCTLLGCMCASASRAHERHITGMVQPPGVGGALRQQCRPMPPLPLPPPAPRFRTTKLQMHARMTRTLHDVRQG